MASPPPPPPPRLPPSASSSSSQMLPLSVLTCPLWKRSSKGLSVLSFWQSASDNVHCRATKAHDRDLTRQSRGRCKHVPVVPRPALPRPVCLGSHRLYPPRVWDLGPCDARAPLAWRSTQHSMMEPDADRVCLRKPLSLFLLYGKKVPQQGTTLSPQSLDSPVKAKKKRPRNASATLHIPQRFNDPWDIRVRAAAVKRNLRHGVRGEKEEKRRRPLFPLVARRWTGEREHGSLSRTAATWKLSSDVDSPATTVPYFYIWLHSPPRPPKRISVDTDYRDRTDSAAEMLRRCPMRKRTRATPRRPWRPMPRCELRSPRQRWPHPSLSPASASACMWSIQTGDSINRVRLSSWEGGGHGRRQEATYGALQSKRGRGNLLFHSRKPDRSSGIIIRRVSYIVHVDYAVSRRAKQRILSRGVGLDYCMSWQTSKLGRPIMGKAWHGMGSGNAGWCGEMYIVADGRHAALTAAASFH